MIASLFGNVELFPLSSAPQGRSEGKEEVYSGIIVTGRSEGLLGLRNFVVTFRIKHFFCENVFGGLVKSVIF